MWPLMLDMSAKLNGQGPMEFRFVLWWHELAQRRLSVCLARVNNNILQPTFYINYKGSIIPKLGFFFQES